MLHGLKSHAQEMESAWLRRDELQKKCKDAGFTYIAIDLTGYRTGAMNEVLNKSVLHQVVKFRTN